MHATNTLPTRQKQSKRNFSSAREVDEKVALDTGVLKNHRNDTFTRLARNTARTTHAYKKAQETRQQKKTLNIVDEDSELASLKDSQKENAARIKQLKATKSNIAKKGKSSKAESSSSGKVAAMGITVSKRKRAEKTSRLATIKEGTFYIQSVFASF
jgi:16S rRNA C967 or C1407 C5-methylase (RsmB/RsmF family)